MRPEAVSLPLPPGPPADQGALGSSVAHAFVAALEMLARRGQDRGIYPRNAERILRDERRPKPILWYCPECGVGPQPGEEGTVVCAHCGQEHQLAIAEAKGGEGEGYMKKRLGPGGEYATGWHVHRGLHGFGPYWQTGDDLDQPWGSKEEEQRASPWFWAALLCLMTVMFWAGYYFGATYAARLLRVAPVEVGP